MSSKRSKRIKEINKEVSSYFIDKSIDNTIETKSLDELFVVDTIGSKSSKRKIEKAITNEKSNDPLKSITSSRDKVLLQRALNNNNKVIKSKYRKSSLHDLWGNDIVDSKDFNDSDLNKKKLSSFKSNYLIPKPGLSYHPEFNDHQNLLAAALANEMKKNESNMKISQLSFDNTIEDSIDEHIDYDSDDDDSYVTDNNITNKKKERLTRSQKNKRKAHNTLLSEYDKKNLEKQFLQSIDKLPKLLSEIEKEEKMKEINREIKLLKKQKRGEDIFTYEDAAIIPLSDELSGSLRLLKPKGVPIKEQARVMQTNGMIVPKKRKAKRYDKPHAMKRVVWIPKYKYNTIISRSK